MTSVAYPMKPDKCESLTSSAITDEAGYSIVGWATHLLFLNSSDFFRKYSNSCSTVIPFIVSETLSRCCLMNLTASNFFSVFTITDIVQVLKNK